MDPLTTAWCRYLDRLEAAAPPEEARAAWAEYRAAISAISPHVITVEDVRAALDALQAEGGEK